MESVIEILRDNWLLLLIGQYPNGPLGGIACTLILSVLGIVLAFPLSVLLALARLSPWRWLSWPATALIYVARGVPLPKYKMPCDRQVNIHCIHDRARCCPSYNIS